MLDSTPDIVVKAWAIVAALANVAASFALGNKIVGQLAIQLPCSATRFILKFGVGYNALSWLAVVASLLGLSQPKWLLPIVAVLASYGLWLGLRGLSYSNFVGLWSRLRKHGWLTLVGLAAIGPAACYPETWDELVYHCELPQRWLADAQLGFYWDLPYSAFPSLVEINSWLIAPIEPIIGPRIILGFIWLSGLWLVYANLRFVLEHFHALALTLAFALTDTMLLTASGAYVEAALLLNFLLLMLLLQTAAHDPSCATWRYSFALGLLAGGCGAIKLTGMAILLLVFALQLLRVFKALPAQPERLQQLLVFTAASVVLVAPFFIRPWLASGNPLFPYFESWFTNNAARIESSQYHHAIGSAFGTQGLSAWVLSPLLLSFNQSVFDGTFGLQSALLCVVILVRSVMLVRARKIPSDIVVIAIATVWLFTFWYLTAQQARFAIPAEAGLWLLAAWLIQGLAQRARNAIACGVLVLALLSLPWPATNFYIGVWLANVGLVDNRILLSEATGDDYLPLADAIDELTLPTSRIMLVLEHRSFFLPRDTIVGTPFFQSAGFTPPEDFETAEKCLGVLLQMKATHLVVATRPLGPDVPEVWAERLPHLRKGLEDAAARGWLEPMWASDTHQLLRVTGPPTLDSQ